MTSVLPENRENWTWIHYFPFSLMVHIIVMAIWFGGLPDQTSWQDEVLLAPSLPSVYRIPVVAQNVEVNLEISESISEDEDPFAEEVSVIAAPSEMHFEKPKLQETPHIPEVEQITEREIPQENQVPKIEKTAKVKVEREPAPSSVEKVQTEHEIAESSTGATASLAESSETANHSDHRISAEDSQGKTGHPGGTEKAGALSGHGESSGQAAVSPDVWASYTKKLNEHFKKHQYYPAMARQRRMTGKVMISADIRRDGEILSVQVTRSSGNPMLDDAAIQSAKKASPVPAFPDDVSEDHKTVSIPYIFSLK